MMCVCDVDVDVDANANASRSSSLWGSYRMRSYGGFSSKFLLCMRSSDCSMVASE